MRQMTIAALWLACCAAASCSTTATPKDIDLTNAGIQFGIEACERHVIDGVPLDQAVTEGAQGRKHESYRSTVPGSNLTAPNWKLDGLVWVGLNSQGKCDVYSASGSGPTARDMVISTHLGMSSRKWSRMRIVAAPAGETRDAVCTTDRVGDGKSLAVVMTSRTDNNVTLQRTFVATVMSSKAEECSSRLLP